ncbi:hypothetical protein MMC07_000637 [Pseudocyphellaria aurata]|nr:hypothetical protein [Pseudocyphellaria aurata]
MDSFREDIHLMIHSMEVDGQFDLIGEGQSSKALLDIEESLPARAESIPNRLFRRVAGFSFVPTVADQAQWRRNNLASDEGALILGTIDAGLDHIVTQASKDEVTQTPTLDMSSLYAATHDGFCSKTPHGLRKVGILYASVNIFERREIHPAVLKSEIVRLSAIAKASRIVVSPLWQEE